MKRPNEESLDAPTPTPTLYDLMREKQDVDDYVQNTYNKYGIMLLEQVAIGKRVFVFSMFNSRERGDTRRPDKMGEYKKRVGTYVQVQLNKGVGDFMMKFVIGTRNVETIAQLNGIEEALKGETSAIILMQKLMTQYGMYLVDEVEQLNPGRGLTIRNKCFQCGSRDVRFKLEPGNAVFCSRKCGELYL